MRVTGGNSKLTGRLYLDWKDTISEVKIPGLGRDQVKDV